jgi:hypothetical protein
MPQNGSIVWYLLGFSVWRLKAIRYFVLFVRYNEQEFNLFGTHGKQSRRGCTLRKLMEPDICRTGTIPDLNWDKNKLNKRNRELRAF